MMVARRCPHARNPEGFRPLYPRSPAWAASPPQTSGQQRVSVGWSALVGVIDFGAISKNQKQNVHGCSEKWSLIEQGR